MKATVMKMSILLLGLLIAAGLAACRDSAEPKTEVTSDIGTETQAPQETEEVRIPGPEKTDLNGFELRVASWAPFTDYIIIEEANGDVVDDTLYNADLAVMEEYNCVITNALSADFPVVTDTIHTAVLAGDNAYGLSYNHDCQTVANVLKNCFLDIRSCDVFNFDAPWWTDTVNTFTVNDRLYFASNFLTYSPMYQAMILCYNKDLANTYDIEIPYDDIFAGNWYMEDLIAMVQNTNADVNGDSDIVLGEDQFGFISNSLGMACIQVCLGGTILVPDEEGYLSLDVDLNRLQTMSETFSRLMEFGVDTLPDGRWDYGTSYFSHGQSLFNYSQISMISSTLRDADFRYGTLPFPKLDEQQKNYITSVLDAYWAIPTTVADDVDAIATILEAKAQRCFYEVLPVSFETALQTKFSDAPEDAKTYEIIRDTMIVDAGYAYNEQDGGIANLIRILSNTDSGTLSSFVEKNIKSAEKAVEKINETYQKMGDLG